jgi:hypothetical protein
MPGRLLPEDGPKTLISYLGSVSFSIHIVSAHALEPDTVNVRRQQVS